MNLKNLLTKLFGIVVLLTLLSVSEASAQATFYVNNSTGSDGYDGLSPTWTGGSNGPKLSLAGAYAAAPGIGGSPNLISIAFTGNPYTEAGPITIAKAVNLTSTGGAVVFQNASLVLNLAAGTNIGGPIQFVNLTLTAGPLTGATNLTVSGNVTRTAGTVDGQINYTAGLHNFLYDGAAAITSGGELPPAANTTNFGNLTTANAGTNLTLNESKTMNGIINTVGTLNLGGGTLTIRGGNNHIFSGLVSNGTLAFNTNDAAANATIAGVGAPNITANITVTDPAGGNTPELAINNTINNVANLTANNAGQITANNAGTIGDITNNGSRAITTGNANVAGNVLMGSTAASTALITLNNAVAGAYTVTSITQSGFGAIAYGGSVNQVTVNQNVLLNTAWTFTTAAATANQGSITFPNFQTTVTGSVTNDASFGGTSDDAGNQNLGIITFQATNVDVTLGSIVNSSRSTATLSGAGTFLNNGDINFAYLGTTAGNDFLVTGAVTNSSTINGAFTSGGRIQFTGVTNSLGSITVNGALTNSSSTTTGNNNVGTINFLAASAAANVNGVSQTNPAVVTTAAAHGFATGNIVYIAGTNVAGINGLAWTVTVLTGTTFSIVYDNTGGPVPAAGGTATAVSGAPTNAGSVSSIGGVGGDIQFGIGNFNTAGNVTNSRTAAGADILFGSNALYGTTVGATYTSASILNSGASSIVVGYTGNGLVTINGNLTNSGAGNVAFPGQTTGNVNINGTITNSGAGTSNFGAMTAGLFTARGMNLSAGTIFIRGNAGVVTTIGQANQAGVVSLTGGILDFVAANVRNFVLQTSSITIGGTGQNPTFNNTGGVITMLLSEPIPNVTQTVNIGNFNPVWPGDLLVQNNANIPAPVVRFANASPGNLFVLGGQVTFNNGAVLNSVELDGVKIYVGDKNLAISGDFQNTTGYTTINDGRVVMYGSALQTVQNLGDAVAGAYFGSFEVDNSAGLVVDVNMRTAGNDAIEPIFTDFFYLSLGIVEGQDVEFDRPAPLLSPPYPTIVRSAGSFDAAPIFTSRVNVTYIGGDKATAFEVPVAANRLNDFTVATTTGANPGFGVVTLGGATTCLGTLTVNTNQTLLLNDFNFTLGGPSAVVNGNVVNSFGAPVEYLVLGAATGTAITGTGNIPSIQIAAGSVGNTLGGTGIVDFGFGQDNAWGGIGVNADDFATKDGNFVYAGGAASSLTVSFTGAGPHFANLTTAAGGTFTLGANARMSGDINHVAGTIDLDGFTLTHNGVAPQMTGGALILSNPGFLLFNTAATIFTVNAGPATIGANVNVNTEGNFTLAGGNLTITGNLSLLDSPPGGAPGATFQIGGGLTLTAAGAQVNVAANCSFTAPAPGTGILLLDVAAPNTVLTYNTPANSAVANLTIADNVTLAGGILGSDLTVGTAFVHNAGELNFGNADLVTNGTFTRTGGTYSGSGFLRHAGGGWNHGPAMVINNIDFTGATNIGATANTLTVNDYLRLGAVLTQANNTSQVIVGDGVGATTVEVNGGGNFSVAANQVAPTFVGITNYLFTGNTSVPNLFTWPANQANNVTLNLATNAQEVQVNNSRAINGDLDVTLGDLVWDGGIDISFPNAASTITRREDNSILNNDGLGLLGTGTLTANSINLAYQNAAANINTGLEYTAPNTVNNFTLLPIAPNNNTTVTIVNSRTVAGTLSMASVLNFGTGTTTNWTLPQTIPGGSTVNAAVDVAGLPIVPTIVNWNGGLTVNGIYNNSAGNLTATGGTFVTAGGLFGSGAITNNAGGRFNVTGGSTGTWVLINNGTMTLDGMTQTAPGTTTLGTRSTTNFLGDATINGLILPNATAIANLYDNNDGNVDTWNAVAGDAPTINTFNNLTFTGAVPANPYLNLNFAGNIAQTVGLPGSMNIQNLTLNKGSDQTVTFSGGNITLNPAATGTANIGDFDLTNIPAGLLTLTRGILVIGNIAAGPPAVPALLTLNLTVAGGFITNLGYVRNPAQVTHYAHVVGRLGVAIPAGTIGRSEWPVGSANPNYRPAAITFTAGNATIAPTTIIVEHIDGTPAGNVNLPLVGGTKFSDPNQTLYIGSKAPYSWKVLATTSLGASQRFDLELQGTNLNRQFETVNDLRIIRRFDGDIMVNGWFLQGDANNYSNIMQENVPTPGDTIITARNQNSQGGIVQQAAFFTLGIPSQAPIFTAVLANQAINEGQALNFTYIANDPDVNAPAPVFSLVQGPAGATINSATGVFSFTPDFTQGNNNPSVYTVVVRAAKGNDPNSFAETSAQVTVNNVNRAPAFVDELQDQTITDGQTLNFTYTANDLDIATDGQALTFAAVNVPAGATVSAGGVFSWTPTFAQAGATYPVQVSVTDNGVPPIAVNSIIANITVDFSRIKGDVGNPATVPPTPPDGQVTAADAPAVLQYAVGKQPGFDYINNDAINFWAADVSPGGGDGNVTAYDAASILRFAVSGVFLPKSTAYSGDLAYGSLKGEEDVVKVPIRLSNASMVISAQLEFEVPENVEVVGFETRLPEGWISVENIENGKIAVAMAGVEELKDGDIAVISFRLNDKEQQFTLKGSAQLNYGQVVLQDLSVRQIPGSYDISQNYPNPFNPTTKINFQVPENQRVSLTIYDMLGKKVKTLVNEVKDAGYYSVEWNGTNEYGTQVTSGVYFYRIEAGSFVTSKKMNFIK